MKEKTLTPVILTKFVIKVLTTVNQDNFLTIGTARDLEIQKIAKIVAEFFEEDSFQNKSTPPEAADINVAHLAADKAIPDWEEGFKKTKFATGGGLSFECSDYEGMYDDLLDFIRDLIKQQRSEVAREIKEWAETNEPKDGLYDWKTNGAFFPEHPVVFKNDLLRLIERLEDTYDK